MKLMTPPSASEAHTSPTSLGRNFRPSRLAGGTCRILVGGSGRAGSTDIHHLLGRPSFHAAIRGFGRGGNRRCGSRWQAVLGVLERLLNAGNAGRIARLTLIDGRPGLETLGLLSPLGTHVEILLVLADERGAILGVAPLRERNTRQGDSDDSQQALQGSVHDSLHCSIIEPRRIVR